MELTFEQFADGRTASDVMAGFPSDRYCIREEIIGDTSILISWEDEQYTAVFLREQILYTLFTERLDQDEAEKILYSFFDEP